MQRYDSKKVADQRQFLQKSLTENRLRERSSHRSCSWKVKTKLDGDVQQEVEYLPAIRHVPIKSPLLSRVQTVDDCLLQLGTGFFRTGAGDVGGWSSRGRRML